MTGLSGAGKTTLAQHLFKRLRKEGYSALVLDGDEIRRQAHSRLGFSAADIRLNNRLVAERCLQLVDTYDFIIVTLISPFRDSRAEARKLLGNIYTEIFINVSIEEAIRRDVKGLYKRALNGEISNFIGISPEIPYEEPQNPELTIDTGQYAISEAIEKIWTYLHTNLRASSFG